jgi:hypothetical protein
VYLEVLVCIRSYTDWKSYRLKTSVADLDLVDLLDELSTGRPANTEDILRKPLDETGEAGAYRAARGFGSPDLISRKKRALAVLRARRDEVREFREKKLFIGRQISSVKTSRSLRFVWEILFPVLFGAIAITVAVTSQVKP